MHTVFNKLIELIDQFTERVGQAISWLVIFLVILVVYDVSMRYLFQSGSIAIQELQWHIFSIIFLLGAGYTLKDDEHVRLDLLYKSRFLSEKHRAWIDALGALLILIPFCWLIIYCAQPFVSQAFTYNEASPDPGGLPARWLIKAMIPVGFMLLMLQACSQCLKKFQIALGNSS